MKILRLCQKNNLVIECDELWFFVDKKERIKCVWMTMGLRKLAGNKAPSRLLRCCKRMDLVKIYNLPIVNKFGSSQTIWKPTSLFAKRNKLSYQ